MRTIYRIGEYKSIDRNVFVSGLDAARAILGHDQTLKAVLERAATWPEWAQDDLAQLALEIDGQLSAGTYRATRDELEKIDEALAAVRRGEVASADEVEAAFANHL